MPRRAWLPDVFALAAFAVALVVRIVVDPVLPPGFPFLTFFPAVIVTTLVAGLRPGILCATLSGIAAWYVFIAPNHAFVLTPPVALALAFYVFVVTIDIALIHLMDRAGERLRAERLVTHALYEQQRTMFQELQHRVANNMQFVASVLMLQRRRAERDPAGGAQALAAAEERLAAFAGLHRRLYDPAAIANPVCDTLRALCSDLAAASSGRPIIIDVEGPDLTLDLTRLTTLSLLTMELVTNAIKHAFPDDAGTIIVALEASGRSRYRLAVTDDGRGLPKAAAEADSGRGLGFRIVQSLAKQLGGTLTYGTAPGGGTRVTLEFEVAPPLQAAAQRPGAGV